MKIHWLITGSFNSTEDLTNSNMASIQMRAGLVKKYVSDFQLQLTVGDHVNLNADIIIVGKIGMDCQNGRDNLWFRYLYEAHKQSKRIIIDYTDNHLEFINSPVYLFYKNILPLTDKAVVPSSSMSKLLSKFFANEMADSSSKSNAL